MNALTQIDFTILNFIKQNFSCAFFDFIMPKITMLADKGFLWILCGIILLFIKKYRKYGICMLVCLAIGATVTSAVIKPIVARPRPFIQTDNIKLLIDAPKDMSFPSGHTMASVISAIIITAVSKKAGIIAWITAVLIIFSRLYLYVHFPSDIAASAVIAAAISVSALKILKKGGKPFVRP